MWVPFEQLPASARLWIFSSPVPLDTDLLLPPLQEFIRSWTAHQQDLRASASLSEGYFMLLAVDEAQTSASGCSIDKATHFVHRGPGQASRLKVRVLPPADDTAR